MPHFAVELGGKHIVPVHANSLEDSTGLEDQVPASFIEQKSINIVAGWLISTFPSIANQSKK